jgi:hypothetical protein
VVVEKPLPYDGVGEFFFLLAGDYVADGWVFVESKADLAAVGTHVPPRSASKLMLSGPTRSPGESSDFDKRLL